MINGEGDSTTAHLVRFSRPVKWRDRGGEGTSKKSNFLGEVSSVELEECKCCTDGDGRMLSLRIPRLDVYKGEPEV